MRYWEILVFCLGISLDVFGAAVCQGAVLGELRRRRIALYCLIFCAAQVAAMEIGRLLGMLPRFASYYTVAQGLWHILGALIFFVLGVCLIVKAVRKKTVFEHRTEITYKKVVGTAVTRALIRCSRASVPAFSTRTGSPVSPRSSA